MDINFQYTKLRRNCGRQPMFCEAGPLLCDSIAVNALEHRSFILRNPVHQATQSTPCFSKSYVNTIRAEFATSGINHAEGGWPRDVNLLDPEATQRYRRKIEKDDNYIHCVQAVSPVLDHYIMQNNAIDMYEAYFAEMLEVGERERIGCRTVNVYRDPAPAPRPVSSACWEPGAGRRLAVTYADVDFDREPRGPLLSYIWDVEDPMAPETTVKPPCALLDLQFNPRDSSVLAGGLVNGQVGLWDRRAGGEPVAACAPHVAHRDLVRSVLFVAAKSGQEFFSSGPDGACKWWDMRHMAEPVDEMIIDVVKSSSDEQSMASAYGVSVLEFEPTIPTRFMVGTENGLVIGANRKGKTPLEQLPAKFNAHVGPVFSLERNPGFLKNFLTVGDWTARVWSEECRDSAVLWSPPLRHKVTAGAWSPVRLSLLALTQWDGTLALWDLLRRQFEPVLTVQVCQEPLLTVRVHEKGTLVACCSRKGNIYLTELSKTLAQSDKNDKGLLTLMLERESKRERILEARLREIKLKQRQGEGGAGTGEGEEHDDAAEAAQGDRDLADAAAEYMAQVKRELAAIT